MARRAHTKSRTGCQTCKIRRIRCDESWPACKRCTSTGRRCDGPSKAATTPVTISFASVLTFSMVRPQPAILAYESDQEARYVRYFLDQISYNPSGQSGYPPWGILMVQALYENIAVRRCAMAISALIQVKQTNNVCTIDRSSSDKASIFALKRYGKALSSLQELVTRGDRKSVETVLLCGIICIWFEILRKDYFAALGHLDRCLNIILATKVPGKGMIDSDIENAYMKLDTQAAIYVGMRAPVVLPEELKPVPYIFDTFDEAEGFLIVEYGRVIRFARKIAAPYRYPQPGWIPLELLAHAQMLHTRLEHWHSAFKYSYACQKAEGTPQMITRVSQLLIQYHAAVITVSTCLYSEETIYDRFLPIFKRILVQVERLTAYWHERGLLSPSGVSMDLGIVQPLYLIATKCRNFSVRQQAIEFLFSTPDADGTKEGLVFALVARRAKELEERGLDVAVDGVPEFCRIHVIGVKVNRDLREAHVELRRRPNGMDGEWEEWKEILSW